MDGPQTDRHPESAWNDERVEVIIGRMLQIGVATAALTVLAGGIAFLLAEGGRPADHERFHGEPPELISIEGVVRDAIALDSPGVIQLGLLLLIATPIARVVFSIYAFAREHDWLYVALTFIVLGVLLYSLLGGPA